MIGPFARFAPLPFALAAVAALLTACGSPPVPQVPPEPAAVPESSAALPPADPPVDAPEPPLATEDDLVRVPEPRGQGWECGVEHVEDPRVGVNASFIQCRNRTPGGVVNLMAKDYTVPRSQIMTAEALSTIEYPKHYTKRWDHVNYTKSGKVDHHGHPAYEVTIELARDNGQTLHLVERVIVVDNHTMNLSADAPPPVFAAFKRQIDRWFDTVEFATLSVGDPAHRADLRSGFPTEIAILR